jgi:hypothetical protein
MKEKKVKKKPACKCICHEFHELKWILHKIKPCECKRVKIKSNEVPAYLKTHKRPNNIK